ncbi:universal stress protein [[Haemophilus] felis]|uniref:Universal stress protein UspA n=1 Tax=[Haemophilus] felis TaxID=123822 RepID=A0A1T0B6R1_9PAST|nr:universal stress protein [[Haemophilus] felis]NBI39954.1 universal stress protein [[Haemophilus] felis]NBI42239.1 universal stress protein [[Haemophilus] felis]OOS05784.1 universal stress protein UspA [[Haemophilus] felis]
MFKKILITADLSHLEDAKKAVQTALELTQHNPDTIYRVMSVVPPLGSSFVSSFLPKNFDKDVMAEANQALHQFTKENFPEGVKVQHIVAHGPVYEEINRIAQEKNVDLIIMMAAREHRDGLSSNTVKVARYSEKPILILR